MDLAGEFRAIRDINQEIRRLTLASYAPLRYVLPHKQAAYDDAVQHPDVVVAEPGLRRARDGGQPRDDVGRQRHGAPVVVVRQGPAVQAHDDERNEREQPHEPDRGR